MQRPWTIKEGPEYAKSVDECGVPDERLQVHLAAIRCGLRWDPWLHSHPFDGDARRVIRTNDYVGEGFTLSAYYVLYNNFTLEIKWIEASPLPDGESDLETMLEADTEGDAPAAA